MTIKGGTSQACAACKFQRRKCVPECPLAPYFPPDQPRMFQNAHKLFGVSKLLRILKNLDVAYHDEAMKSIIKQANIRDRFPVHGCVGVIHDLWCQIFIVEEQLQLLTAHLERQRSQLQISGPSQLELGMAPPSNNNSLSLFNNNQEFYNGMTLQQNSYSVSSSVGCNNSASAYIDSKDTEANSLWVHHQYVADNTNEMAIHAHLVASQPLTIQQDVVHDYDEMHPFFDATDDRQSYIVLKEAYESSSEESLKDTTQSAEHVAENELKNAAACFSLTSVN